MEAVNITSEKDHPCEGSLFGKHFHWVHDCGSKPLHTGYSYVYNIRIGLWLNEEDWGVTFTSSQWKWKHQQTNVGATIWGQNWVVPVSYIQQSNKHRSPLKMTIHGKWEDVGPTLQESWSDVRLHSKWLAPCVNIYAETCEPLQAAWFKCVALCVHGTTCTMPILFAYSSTRLASWLFL